MLLNSLLDRVGRTAIDQREELRLVGFDPESNRYHFPQWSTRPNSGFPCTSMRIYGTVRHVGGLDKSARDYGGGG